jgi:hypothetical protein
MKACLTIVFFIQTGISLGIFPEMNIQLPNEKTQDKLLEYRNNLINNIEEAGEVCGHVDETDERQMKMILRLKRISRCKGRESRN